MAAIDPKQNRQGGNGGIGASTGDSSGVGVKRFNPTPGQDLTTKFKRGALTAGDVSAAATPIAQTISGTAGEIGNTLEKKGLLRTIGQPVVDFAKAYGEGAAGFNERIKSMLPEPSKIGRFIVGSEIADRPKTAALSTPSSIATASTPSPISNIISEPKPITAITSTPSEVTPTVSTTPTLGTFTTPTGGSASITKPGGGSVFTPDQQSSLQTTLNREADPAFKARLAEQAAIVDARRSGLGDMSPASVQKQLESAISADEPTRVAYLRDLLNQTVEAGTKQDTLTAATANKRLDQQIEARKALGADRSKAINDIMAAQKEGASAMTKNAIWKSHNQGPHDISSVKLVHQDDPVFEDALSSGDPQKISDMLVKAGHSHEDVINILRTAGF